MKKSEAIEGQTRLVFAEELRHPTVSLVTVNNNRVYVRIAASK